MQSNVYSTEEKKEPKSPRHEMHPAHESVKKKDPVVSEVLRVCAVCGGIASGCNYNALTCFSCKDFFKRSFVRNTAEYRCKYGNNNCEIDMNIRRKCQKCWWQKCSDAGMKKTRKYQRTTSEKKAEKEKKPIGDNASYKETSVGNSNRGQPRVMAEKKKCIMTVLLPLQEEYESLLQEDLQKAMAVIPLGDGSASAVNRFHRILAVITILTTERILPFARNVPGFNNLVKEDQETLLSACATQVITLRIARKYDMETDSIIFADNLIYTRENYSSVCRKNSADPFFEFCRNMRALEVDNAEYALLTAIVIFTERPNLLNPKNVRGMLDFYTQVLKTYVTTYRTSGKKYFDELFKMIVELRVLCSMHSQESLDCLEESEWVYLRFLTDPSAREILLSQIGSSRASHFTLSSLFGEGGYMIQFLR